MSTERLIFLHVPKTSGTTMRHILEAQYGADKLYCIYENNRPFHTRTEFAQLSTEAKRRFRVYMGHLDYGLHRQLPVPTRYCAFMRNPVTRVISYYHHVMSHNPHYKKSRASLLKFLSSRDPQVDNHQTRLLSGVSPKFGLCTEQMLWTAIENVDTDFVLVGLTERFDESLLLLGKLLAWADWSAPRYEAQNVSINKPAETYYSDQEINAVKHHNRFDIILYSYVERLLQDKLRQAGAALEIAYRTVQKERAPATQSATSAIG
jgi:hypothetical protein